MLVLETTAKIRRAYFGQRTPIKALPRSWGFPGKWCGKSSGSGATKLRYEREHQPYPKIGPWRNQLDALFLANEGKATVERLTLVRL